MSLQDVMNKPQMDAANNNIDMLDGIASMLKSASDPGTLLQQIIMMNPMAQQAKKMADQCGGFEQAARAVAQQKGLDINELIKRVKNL